MKSSAWTGVAAAMGAALLFGASVPLAKPLLAHTSPWMLAALLYLGSGVGLALLRVLRRQPLQALQGTEWRWLAGAIVAGGMLGPVLLMLGLANMPAAHASLLLNAEGVLTALLEWVVFRENVDRHVALGMLVIVAGGLARRGTLHTRIRDGRVGAVARAGSHRGVPGLGGGQQPDAQGVAVGCLADRHAQGAGGWGHQPGDCTCAGCHLARRAAGGGCGSSGVFMLRRQSDPVRGGLAPPGHGAHGGLFFSGTFPGGGAGRGLAR